MIMNLHYTEALVRRAVRRFYWSHVGPLYVLAMLLVLAGLAFAVVRRDTSWVTGVLATLLALSLALLIVLYRSLMKASLVRYRALAGQPAILSGDITSFVIQSVAGSNTMSWQTVSAIRRYDDMWLLALVGGGFFTIPLEGTKADEREFLMDRVMAHGGKVV